MSEIATGGPPPTKSSKTSIKEDIEPLVNKAMEEPGEWFNTELDAPPANVRSSLTYTVAKVVSEWAVRDGVLYFRFK